MLVGGMSLGVHGDANNSIDVSTPSSAWMVPLVADENTAPSLFFSVDYVKTKFDGKDLIVSIAVLSSMAPDESSAALALVKMVDGKKHAVLKRGLVWLGFRLALYVTMKLLWVCILKINHLMAMVCLGIFTECSGIMCND